YLLQRIEEYSGLVVVSTNQKINIDDAFSRRFQSVIRFPMPDAAQRKAIWTSSFSDKTEFEESISWDDIARDYELTGGSIMNVVQYASVLAMSRGESIIREEDILHGIRREYQKEGKMPR
ncbi:MAG: ATP-binding protein, partial [Bacteroidales bacterium]|nr:ATP-binding protein [Bacteroidales bacterium]